MNSMPGTSSARMVGENAPVRDELVRADDAAETADVAEATLDAEGVRE